jgi:polar amino acid transport system substrate-binding protein
MLARKFIGYIIAAALTTISALPTLAQDASDLQTIKNRGVLRVGAAVAAPYYTKVIETGAWQGLAVDLAGLIAAQLGVKVELIETQWGEAAAGLQTNRFDIMIGFTATPSRALAVDFTEPIGGVPFGVIAKASDAERFSTWLGMNDSKVQLVAVDGTGSTIQMKPILSAAQWHLMPSYDAEFLELDSGRQDAGLMDAVNAKGYLKNRAGKNLVFIKPTPNIATDTNIALKKSNPTEMLRWLNLTIRYLDQRGELKTLWAKYTD